MEFLLCFFAFHCKLLVFSVLFNVKIFTYICDVHTAVRKVIVNHYMLAIFYNCSCMHPIASQFFSPNLGWRDVQHLIARTSSSKFNSVPWRTNKAGLRGNDLSLSFSFSSFLLYFISSLFLQLSFSLSLVLCLFYLMYLSLPNPFPSLSFSFSFFLKTLLHCGLFSLQ